MAVRIAEEHLNGLIVIDIDRYHDDRGYFEELFHLPQLKEIGITESFVQDNHSRSVRSVIRGMHYQHTPPQGKLLTVLKGAIQLVELDLRQHSTTYGQHISLILSDDTPRLVWIPAGFANGFCCLSDDADVLYKCTAPYNASGEGSINPLDPVLAIDWHAVAPILSAKDRQAQSWASYEKSPHF